MGSRLPSSVFRLSDLLRSFFRDSLRSLRSHRRAKSRGISMIPALEHRQMLSGSTDITVNGGMGVHMAAIALPGGAQSFVGITLSPMPGLAYLDPDNSTQVIYDANGATTSDSFTFSYIDGMGMTDTYTVNITITGSGTGSGSGSGSGSASGSESGSGTGSAYSVSSGSGSGSGSSYVSAANTPPTIAGTSLRFAYPMYSGGVIYGSFEGDILDATPSGDTGFYDVEINTVAAESDEPTTDYTFTNANHSYDYSPMDFSVSGNIADSLTHVWARVIEYIGYPWQSTNGEAYAYGDWQWLEVEVDGTAPPNPWKMADRTTVQSGADYTVTGSGPPNDNTTATLELQKGTRNSAGNLVYAPGTPEQITVGANGKWTMTYTAATVPQGVVKLEYQFVFKWGNGPTQHKEDYFKIVP